MRVCFLGTGGSWPTKERNTSSVAVTYGRTTVLLDCGEGTQRQMMHTPVSPSKVRAVLITHLHGDHFLGLAGLVQSMSLNGREADLVVMGPPGTAVSVERAIGSTLFTPGFDVVVDEVRDGDRRSVGELSVRCALADHTVPDIAYRIDTPERPGRFDRDQALRLGIPEGPLWGRLQRGSDVTFRRDGRNITVGPGSVMGQPRPGLSIVYTGDTRPCDSVIRLSSGADALVHESTYTSRYSALAQEYKHSTSAEAARVAKEAGVGALYLFHPSPRFSDEGGREELLAEARSIFGRSYLAEDLECVEVSR